MVEVREHDGPRGGYAAALPARRRARRDRRRVRGRPIRPSRPAPRGARRDARRPLSGLHRHGPPLRPRRVVAATPTARTARRRCTTNQTLARWTPPGISAVKRSDPTKLSRRQTRQGEALADRQGRIQAAAATTPASRRSLVRRGDPAYLLNPPSGCHRSRDPHDRAAKAGFDLFEATERGNGLGRVRREQATCGPRAPSSRRRSRTHRRRKAASSDGTCRAALPVCGRGRG